MNYDHRAVLYFSMVLPFVSSLFYFIYFEGSDTAKLVYGATKIYTMAVPAIFYFAVRGEKLSAIDLGSHFSRRNIALGLGSGAAIAAFIYSFYFGLFQVPLKAFSAAIISKCVSFGLDTPQKFIAFGAFLSFPHSFIEEFYWRWLFLSGGAGGAGPDRTRMQGLNGSATRMAVACSVAFSLHHYVVLYKFFGIYLSFVFGTSVMAAGLMWAVLYKNTGSLVPAWISHIIADICVLSIGYSMIFHR